MLTLNIVILLLLIVTAIVGGIQIQSKFEQVMSAQNSSTSQVNELTAKTNANISRISMQLENINSDIIQLTLQTYNNIIIRVVIRAD